MPRAWATHCGFSFVQWREPGKPVEHVRKHPPELDVVHEINVVGNFHGIPGSEHTFIWLPPNAAHNGFDETNVHELEEFRFYIGTFVSADIESRILSFKPSRFLTPYDLADQPASTAPLQDTLHRGQGVPTVLQFGRLSWVGFNFEGDVSSEYLMVDGNLVMLEHGAFSDCHFWIGHAKADHKFLQDLFKSR